MNRYFYDDPLEAAYMAVHYGVKFEGGIFDSVYEMMRMETATARYYIHPDSLHLLDPRLGDMILMGQHTGGQVSGAIVYEKGGDLIITSRTGHEFKVHKVNTVIQRDCKPFFWPEKE